MAKRVNPGTDRFGGPAHQHPELAGDAQVRFPRWVRVAGGFVLGSLLTGTIPPFEGTHDQLLLAESFARLDLADPVDAPAWFRAHGLLDLFAWTDGRSAVPDPEWPRRRRSAETADRLSDIAAEQENVRWHLATLARLSERRELMDWDPAFGRVVLVTRNAQVVVGGPAAGSLLGARDPVSSASAGDAFPEVPVPSPEQLALRRATEAWPRVTIFERTSLPSSQAADAIAELRTMAREFGTTWDATVDLQAFLLAPYVGRALERQVDLKRESVELDGRPRSALVAREVWEWRSVLAPIYVQLFSGLQRITRGELGAAVCRECGLPFVVIDARRRLFCNARERHRHTQRLRRRRLATPAQQGGTDPEDHDR